MDKTFVDMIIGQFRLDPEGIHGVGHWSRVRNNGLRLAKHNGADRLVVEYFAFLHDSQRQSDNHDPEHGLRASEWLSQLDLPLSEDQLSQLKLACEKHTEAQPQDNPTYDTTVMTCWDADRMDLPRIGIQPDSHKLFTREAKLMVSLEARQIALEEVNKTGIHTK